MGLEGHREQTVPLALVATPFPLIDGLRLQHNVAAMQEMVECVGASLRPHFKTHRSSHIAALQLDAGAIGFTCATAAQLAHTDATPEGHFVASPIQLDRANASFLHRRQRTEPALLAVDSTESLAMVRSAIGEDGEAEVLIEVDVGGGRMGVSPEACAGLARYARRLGLEVAGLFAYPARGYQPGMARHASAEEARGLASAAASLRGVRVEPRIVSAGSTPTVRFARRGEATEYRPGTYVFGDAQQLALGSAADADVALTIVSTVIARHGARVVLDAGAKTLGRDQLSSVAGHGRVGSIVISRLFDHHAIAEIDERTIPPVGARVAVIPNNANSAMALARTAWLSNDGERGRPLVLASNAFEDR